MSGRPRLLDLFCGAGGAGMGYHLAGFDVVGVDMESQPNYPFAFVQADATTPPFDLRRFDAVHASPPCQKFSAMTRGRWQDREHPDLLEPVRVMLVTAGVPYVIENVIGAPLLNPITLCGTMFGLGTSFGAQLRRHRLFEAPWCFDLIPQCQHNDGSPIGVYGGGQHPDRRRRPATVGVWGSAGGFSNRDGVLQYGTDERREAMGIGWMTGAELSQAIPPAYTQWIGERLLAHLETQAVA